MNSLEQFLNTLLADLDDLPVYVVEQTKEYYESYFLDAKEEGLSVENILERLGDPSAISSQIKLDYYLYQPKQINKLFKSLFKGILSSKAALTTTKYILGIITYIFAAIFYIVQLALVISGIGTLGATVYLLYTNGFIFNDQGMMYLATGGTVFSLLMIFSVIFKALSFWFRKITVNLVRNQASSLSIKKRRFKPAILVYTSVLIASVVLIFTSPIYNDLFYLWISETPTQYQMLDFTVDETGVTDIRINAENINIFIYYSDVEDIEIEYGKVSYKDFSYHIYNNTLFINEYDNGEIPFFHDFFARHPGALNLTIFIPETMDVDGLDIYTVGSNIYIEDVDYELNINTRTSMVDISYLGECDISIETIRGYALIAEEKYTRYSYIEGNDYMISVQGISTVVRVQRSDQ